MKYTPGAIVGELSGKQGCTVASHNRYGAYFRTRVIPVNPRTLIQNNARNNLGALAKNWSALSAANQAAWNAAATSIVLYDRLGKAYTPTGFQYYCSCGRNVYVYDPAAALPTTPPATATPAALLTATITATSV